MAATACLFNLSKSELGAKIHPKVLKEIVKADLDAMETFPQVPHPASSSLTLKSRLQCSPWLTLAHAGSPSLSERVSHPLSPSHPGSPPPQHQQLQKNVLLTICSDRILQEVNFDKYRWVFDPLT